MAGNADGSAGGEIGRWVLHCHIFHHAEGGMVSELVVLNTIFKSNERPQMTIDNVDVTGIRGQTVTASGSYRDPDGDGISFFEPRDVDTGEFLGTVTKSGTSSSGRWTWSYPVSATDHDRRVKIAESDSRFEVAQMVLDLHVKDGPAEPAPTPTTETPAPAPDTATPTTETPAPQTLPAAVDRTAPAIRGVRVTRLARALRTQLRLSERARLTVTVKRGRRRVARVLKVGVAGRNTVNVRKALGPGRYTVIVEAVDLAGNRGKSVAIRLTVPKG
jgi:hypothetical protein